jgi:hypothetical protein
MHRFLIFLISLFLALSLKAQYQYIPEWAGIIEQHEPGVIYSIGISDPRSAKSDYALDVAIHRALVNAVMMNQMTIFFVSDHFESRTEEHRWYIIQEKIQEMSRFNSYAYVDEDSFELIKADTNKNNEVFVLLKYMPSPVKDTNFVVMGEYFRQDFEVSNTRAMETIRSLHLHSEWQKSEDSEPFRTKFILNILDNQYSTEILYDTLEINPPGYSYEYFDNCKENFNIANFTYGSSMKKGAWIAYIESFIQSCMRLSRNYSSQVGNLHDDYDVNKNDEISGTNRSNLVRQSCINSLGFRISRICTHESSLFTAMNLVNQKIVYIPPATSDSSIETQENKGRSCRLLNLFRKKRNRK